MLAYVLHHPWILSWEILKIFEFENSNEVDSGHHVKKKKKKSDLVAQLSDFVYYEKTKQFCNNSNYLFFY